MVVPAKPATVPVAFAKKPSASQSSSAAAPPTLSSTVSELPPLAKPSIGTRLRSFFLRHDARHDARGDATASTAGAPKAPLTQSSTHFSPTAAAPVVEHIAPLEKPQTGMNVIWSHSQMRQRLEKHAARVAAAAEPPRSFSVRLKEFFSRPSRKSHAAEQEEAIRSPVLAHGPFGKRKPRHKLRRKSLEEYLRKAGYEVDARRVKKIVLLSLIIVFAALTLYFAGGAVLDIGTFGWVSLLAIVPFLIILWLVFFPAAALLLQGLTYFYLDYRIWWRTRELEEHLPDFLQLASANIAAGMPVDRALWYSIRPNFGTLAVEMERVAKATMAGESLENSLRRFAEEYDSPILSRSIAILNEGMRAGGEVADLLNKIALNIEELKIMKKEMAANVTTYAIFITFASVAISPFLFALATQLLEIIIRIMGSLDLSSTGSFFSFSGADPAVIGNFRFFAVAMLMLSTACSTSIVSIIKRGNVFEGIKSIPLYMAVALALYYFSLYFLGGMFSGIAPGS